MACLHFSIVLLLQTGDDEHAPPTATRGQGSFELSGELEAGVRSIDVDGNEAQYDEDLNLEDGIFLGHLSVRGTRDPTSGAVSSFLLEASDVGNPSSSYRLEAQSGPWTSTGRYLRSVYSGNTDSDIHGFDLKRETGSLAFVYAPEAGPSRSSLELRYQDRDGTWNGSRSVAFESVSGFPLRRAETTYGARADFATRADGYGASLSLGFDDSEIEDRSTFSLPSPSFPGSTWTEDYASRVADRFGFAEVRLDRELGRTRLDLGLEWREADALGDLALNETGFLFDPSLPFESDTDGDLELDQREVGFDCGVRRKLGARSEVELRYVREQEDKEGELERTIVLDEMLGEPPTISTLVDTSRHRSRLDLIEASATAPLNEHADLFVRAEWGSEDIEIEDVVEDVVIHFFDGRVDQYGVEASVSFEPMPGWTLDLAAGYEERPTETAQAGSEFRIEDERSTFAALKTRWTGGPWATLSCEGRVEERESEPFQSEGESWSLALSAVLAPSERLRTTASFAYRTYDLETRTTFILTDPMGGFSPVPGLATFDSIQRSAAASLSYQALEELRPELTFSGTISSGDSAFDMLAVGLDVPWEFRPRRRLGARASHFLFDGEGALDPSDYDAWVVEFYLRSSI